MPHCLDLDEFRARNGFSRRSPAANVAHSVSEAVDNKGGDLEMSQALRAIARGHRRHRLTSGANWIVASVVGAARSNGDLVFVARIPRRADGALTADHLLNDFIAGNGRWAGKHFAEHLRRGLADLFVARCRHHRGE